jgi:beta-phosphoglucomutase-like phosphatase (HAD superfamily)
MNIAAGVLWDMDGTLIDSEPIALDALYMALSEVGVAAIPGLHDRVLGLPADEIYAWLVAEHGLSEDWVSWERRKHRHHLAGADRLRVFPDALKVFRVLETAGVPQAIVSNSDRIIMDAQLGRLELSRPGLVTVSRNDVRKGKPEPEGYLRAALLLGCDPAACYVVEDSASGITAGRAAGATTCAVPHASTGLGADVTLREMEEILDLLGLR